MSEELTWDKLSDNSRYIVHTYVESLFFRTAIDDYISARILWHHGMQNSFCWQAGQALEKFIKTALLLNGFSAKGKSHKLHSDFGLLSKKSCGLIPKEVELPEAILEEAANQGMLPKTNGPELFKDCIARFEKNGDPNQRYNQIGHEVDTLDLHKFDFMCLHLSRLGIGVNTLKHKGAMKTPIAHDSFEKFKEFIAPQSSGHELNVRMIFENQNFAFLSNPPSHCPTLSLSFQQSPLEVHIKDQTIDAQNAIEYLCNNSPVKLPKA